MGPDSIGESGTSHTSEGEGTSAAAPEVPPLRHSLSGVSEPLLASLVARHLASSSRRSPLDDPWATTLAQRLALDTRRSGVGRRFQAATAVRTDLVDEVTRAFLSRVDEPTIVTFGAGLCTRYFRIDAPDAQ